MNNIAFGKTGYNQNLTSIYAGALTSPFDGKIGSDVRNDKTAIVYSGYTGNQAVMGIDLGSPICVSKIVLKNFIGESVWLTMHIKQFKLQGNNTDGLVGSTWTDLFTGTTTSSNAGQVDTFIINNTNSYRYYRLYVISNWGYASYISIGEWEIYTDKTKFLLHDGDNVVKYQSTTTTTYTDNLIPTMTSNTTPSGVAKESGYLSNAQGKFMAYLAFDKKTTEVSTWCTTSTNGWIEYDFLQPKIIAKYTLTNQNYNELTRSPKSWTFEGSNDGTNWTILDTQTNVTNWTQNQKREYVIKNQKPFTCYRVNISSNNGASSTSLGEIEMMEILTFEQSEDYNIINNYPPTESDFLNNGMDDISLLYQQGDKYINETISNGETLGSGILHKYHVKKSDMWSITGFECKDV